MNTRSSANPFRNFLVFFFAMGLGLTGIAAYFVADSWFFVNRALHADGVVVAIKARVSSTKRWPIVAFKSQTGARFEFQSNIPNRFWPRPIGTRVDVLYDAHEPSNARVNGFTDVWGLAFCFGIIELGFLALGSVALLKARGTHFPPPVEPR